MSDNQIESWMLSTSGALCFVPTPICPRLSCLVDGFQFLTQRVVLDLKVTHLQVILNEFLGQQMISAPVETKNWPENCFLTPFYGRFHGEMVLNHAYFQTNPHDGTFAQSIEGNNMKTENRYSKQARKEYGFKNIEHW